MKSSKFVSNTLSDRCACALHHLHQLGFKWFPHFCLLVIICSILRVLSCIHAPPTPSSWSHQTPPSAPSLVCRSAAGAGRYRAFPLFLQRLSSADSPAAPRDSGVRICHHGGRGDPPQGAQSAGVGWPRVRVSILRRRRAGAARGRMQRCCALGELKLWCRRAWSWAAWPTSYVSFTSAGSPTMWPTVRKWRRAAAGKRRAESWRRTAKERPWGLSRGWTGWRASWTNTSKVSIVRARRCLWVWKAASVTQMCGRSTISDSHTCAHLFCWSCSRQADVSLRSQTAAPSPPLLLQLLSSSQLWQREKRLQAANIIIIWIEGYQRLIDADVGSSVVWSSLLSFPQHFTVLCYRIRQPPWSAQKSEKVFSSQQMKKSFIPVGSISWRLCGCRVLCLCLTCSCQTRS